MNPIVSNFKVEALSDEDLRLHAPSIFAEGPMSGLSRRYTFVPTAAIVAGLREKSWLPVNVEQERPRSVSRFGFQKHLLRFRRSEQMQTLDEWNGELVLTNSHDAGCAYVVQVGIFRRLCSNGLVVSDESFQALRFRHSGLEAQAIIEASYQVLEFIPKVGALIDQFRNRVLTHRESMAFAERALLTRYGSIERSPVGAETLLSLRRPEDNASDLWTTFNRLQENLVRGGLSDGRRDRRGYERRMRSLRGIDSKIVLNQKLWHVAEQVYQNN